MGFQGKKTVHYIHTSLFQYTQMQKNICLQTKKYWLSRTKEALIKMKHFSKDTTFKHNSLNSAAKFCQEKGTDCLLRLINKAHLGSNIYCS